MKKLLGIVVLGLLLISNIAYSQIVILRCDGQNMKQMKNGELKKKPINFRAKSKDQKKDQPNFGRNPINIQSTVPLNSFHFLNPHYHDTDCLTNYIVFYTETLIPLDLSTCLLGRSRERMSSASITGCASIYRRRLET